MEVTSGLSYDVMDEYIKVKSAYDESFRRYLDEPNDKNARILDRCAFDLYIVRENIESERINLEPPNGKYY